MPPFLLAIGYWRAAAQRASERAAHREAVAHLRKGVELVSQLPEGEERDRLRTTLARLIGVDPADIALVASTSQGVLDIALCLPWRAGDRVVFVRDGEISSTTPPPRGWRT